MHSPGGARGRPIRFRMGTDRSPCITAKKAKPTKGNFGPSVRWRPARHRGARMRKRRWFLKVRLVSTEQEREPTNSLSFQARSLPQRPTRRPVKREYETAAYLALSMRKISLGATEHRATRGLPLAFGLKPVHGYAHAANAETAG